MAETQATISDVRSTIRKVPIHERSVLVEGTIFVNGYRVNRTLLKQRFA